MCANKSLDWTMFAASAVTENLTRDNMISSVHTRAGDSSLSETPLFPASYDTRTGVSNGGETSPSLGAMFAPMALK